MNAAWIVRFTNKIALFAVTFLIIWVVLFSINMIFGLKIFRAHLTDAFGFSILGILAVLAGVLMINIMLNLTRIADNQNTEFTEHNTSTILKWSGKKYLGTIAIGLTLIIALMFAADARTRSLKKELMLKAAQNLSQQYQTALNNYAVATFNESSIMGLSSSVNLMIKSSHFVQRVEIIRMEDIVGQTVPVSVSAYERSPNNGFQPTEHVFKATVKQQEYLQKALQGQTAEPLYQADDGHYWLMYPVKTSGKTLVMYLDDYQNYGKMGS